MFKYRIKFSFRLNEKKIQMKSVGYATLLGAQMGGGTGAWSQGVDERHSSILSSEGSQSSQTRLSEDLGDINLNSETPMDSDMHRDVF